MVVPITGIADTNGDGKISHQEFDINNDGFVDDLNPFWLNFTEVTANSSQTINDQFLSPEQFDAMALENVGTTTLDPSVYRNVHCTDLHRLSFNKNGSFSQFHDDVIEVLRYLRNSNTASVQIDSVYRFWDDG